MEAERITEALDVIVQYAGIDGSHHKMWVIDQVVRCLTGDNYDAWVEAYEREDSDDEGYGEWDTGIAP